jgi:hypothetical protein
VPKKLRTFILANAASQDLAKESLALTDQIPKSWESHRRSLPIPHSGLGEELYDALLSATGEGVQRIRFMPFGLDKDEEPHPLEDVRLNELHEAMAFLLPECITGYLDFEKPFVYDRLNEKVEKDLHDHVDRLFGSHLNVVTDTICCYLAFTLLGERERVQMMVPLIKLLPRVIPIGEYDDEPGAWLGLVGG